MALQIAPRLEAIKKVTVPTEHGGWGFLFEPMLVGLLLAPTRAGAWLGVAALVAFLVRKPLMLALGDLRYGHWYARTRTAVEATLMLSLLGVAALVGVGGEALRACAWVLVLAAPFAAVFLYQDYHRNARSLSGEVAGALAMGALAPMILVAGGWEPGRAVGAWALLGGRATVSILYVRAQVMRLHGRAASFAGVVGAHGGAVVLAAGAAMLGWSPWMGAMAFALLLARAVAGVRRAPATAKALGWSEVRVGLAVVALIVAGYGLGL